MSLNLSYIILTFMTYFKQITLIVSGLLHLYFRNMPCTTRRISFDYLNTMVSNHMGWKRTKERQTRSMVRSCCGVKQHFPDRRADCWLCKNVVGSMAHHGCWNDSPGLYFPFHSLLAPLRLSSVSCTWLVGFWTIPTTQMSAFQRISCA